MSSPIFVKYSGFSSGDNSSTVTILTAASCSEPARDLRWRGR
jgi:hypothetical protein